MTKNIIAIKQAIRAARDKKKAETMRRFFKTGKGGYAEGDIFFGIPASRSRAIAKQFSFLALKEVEVLLRSRIHEERAVALFILIEKFKNEETHDAVYRMYLKNMKWINSWDLVDFSADKIVGAYLYKRKKDILFLLARSKRVWERRIAIVATFYFIKKGSYDETLQIAELLKDDTHDLIHKAVGWMLREVGKRSMTTEERFLKVFYKTMPRTMLRYAIERFPDNKRKRYLFGTI